MKIEAGRHKLWLSEVEAWDTKSEAVVQTYRNNRALLKHARVKELIDEMYTAHGFTEDVPGVKSSKKDTQSGMKATATYMAQRLTKVADKNPARPPSQVLRLAWIDMAQLGLNHSRFRDDLVNLVKTGCENHPDIFCCVILYPNTAIHGKGQ